MDGERFIDEEQPIGTIHLAIDFSDSDRQLLWSEIRRLLVRLSADAFVEPLAGWRPMQPPFDKQTLSADAELPAWTCFESAAGTTVLR
ncbi:MAG: hypothetical protein GTO30_21140, partial [Acidobacteria bacterium]|nr:hypothetical protein [Acidobacteriota bacterium]NIQ84871.1 hypothetical protein [Acidobacteriota bacterium]